MKTIFLVVLVWTFMICNAQKGKIGTSCTDDKNCEDGLFCRDKPDKPNMNDKECFYKIKLNDVCPRNGTCLDKNAYCKPSGTMTSGPYTGQTYGYCVIDDKGSIPKTSTTESSDEADGGDEQDSDQTSTATTTEAPKDECNEKLKDVCEGYYLIIANALNKTSKTLDEARLKGFALKTACSKYSDQVKFDHATEKDIHDWIQDAWKHIQPSVLSPENCSKLLHMACDHFKDELIQNVNSTTHMEEYQKMGAIDKIKEICTKPGSEKNSDDNGQ